MTPHRPHTVAFDVVETLISLEPLRSRFVDVGLQAAALEHWFDRMLRDGMALTWRAATSRSRPSPRPRCG